MAKIVFCDEKIIFLRYGGVFVRVSLNRLLSAKHGSTNDEDRNSSKKESKDK